MVRNTPYENGLINWPGIPSWMDGPSESRLESVPLLFQDIVTAQSVRSTLHTVQVYSVLDARCSAEDEDDAMRLVPGSPCHYRTSSWFIKLLPNVLPKGYSIFPLDRSIARVVTAKPEGKKSSCKSTQAGVVSNRMRPYRVCIRKKHLFSPLPPRESLTQDDLTKPGPNQCTAFQRIRGRHASGSHCRCAGIPFRTSTAIFLQTAFPRLAGSY